MIIGARLAERMAAAGVSQSELARRVGVSQQTIGKLINGGARGSSHVGRIARELATTSAYLEGETDSPDEGALPRPTPELIADQLDLVPIAQIDAEYGMGATVIADHIEQEIKYFPRSFVEAITDSPAGSLVWARGWGDSMAPTIHSSDLILIDLSKRIVREQDVIWAAAIGDMGMVKRLRVRGEQVTILSDNPNVSDDHATADEISIVGKVIFVGRKL